MHHISTRTIDGLLNCCNIVALIFKVIPFRTSRASLHPEVESRMDENMRNGLDFNCLPQIISQYVDTGFNRLCSYEVELGATPRKMK